MGFIIGMCAAWAVEREHPHAVCDSGLNGHGVSPGCDGSWFCIASARTLEWAMGDGAGAQAPLGA